jgi:hypothetical protein
MKRRKVRILRGWPVGCLLPSMLAGCTYWDDQYVVPPDQCANIRPGAIASPNGTFVKGFEAVQTSKAEQDDFVIYCNEWYPEGSTSLGPYGRFHIQQIISRLPTVPFPVIIQPDHCSEELNESRRQTLVMALSLHGIPDADARVIVAYPQAEGLYGAEAEGIYTRMLRGGFGGMGPGAGVFTGGAFGLGGGFTAGGFGFGNIR